MYATDGKIGTNLTETIPGTGTNFDMGGKFAVGTPIQGVDGSRYVYCHAAAAITQYYCVAIDENFEIVHMTKALADAGHSPGFAQVAFADNDFGWVCVHANGNINVRVAASCAADVQLYTTGTAGILDDTSASQNLIRGVALVVAASNTASTRECIAVYPSASATP